MLPHYSVVIANSYYNSNTAWYKYPRNQHSTPSNTHHTTIIPTEYEKISIPMSSSSAKNFRGGVSSESTPANNLGGGSGLGDAGFRKGNTSVCLHF